MAAIDVVAIPDQTDYSTFDDLRLGRSSQKIVGRLLRFWDARNVKKKSEFMGIVLLLLDEKCSVIHGFIRAAFAKKFRNDLKEELIFCVGGFEVGRCTNLHKITENPFLIRFLPSTTIDDVADVRATIETEKFMLQKAHHLKVLANTNLELPDVVGQIKFLQRSNLDEPPILAQRLVVRFMLDSSIIVYLSLWDDVAAKFQSHLSSGDPVNSVMLVTTINPKMFGGKLYLNSTPATRFYFHQNIEAIKEFTKRMKIEATKPFETADTSKGIKNKQALRIAQLFKFILNSKKQPKEADFLCKARVIGVQRENGWPYVSCDVCSRKLDKYGTTLRSNKCIPTNVNGVVRYRVEFTVHDGEARATFLVFDSEMTKLTNRTAASLILEQANGGDEDEIPNFIQEIVGKQYLFQIKETPSNFASHQRTFTVSKITQDN